MFRWLGRGCLGVVLASLALAAQAGVTMKVRSTTEAGNNAHHEVTEVISDGDKARVNFIESDNPMMGPGSYVLRTAETTYLVNPERKSYMRIDKAEIDAMGQQASQSMANTHQQMQKQGMDAQSTLSGFDFKTLVDEAGPAMAGMPTRHYKFHLSYQTTRKLGPGVSQNMGVERTEEFWAATGLPGGGVSEAIAAASAGMADSFAEVQSAEKTMAEKGLRLKSISTSKTTGGLGGAYGTMMNIGTFGAASHAGGRETKRTSEVLELHQGAVAASMFDLPKGYTETSMMGPGGNMPDLNQMPGAPPSGQPNGMPDLNHLPQGTGGMPDLNHMPHQ